MLVDKGLEISLHAAAKTYVSAQFKNPRRGGGVNPNPYNKGDQAGGQPKDKGTAPIKGKPGAKLDKLQPRPHPKVEAEHETQG
jgi:hypothetical protein